MRDDWRLRALRSASIVYFVGIPTLTESARAYDAFTDLLSDREALLEFRTTLRAWVDFGTPTAQLYGAVLLGRLDPHEGRVALHDLASSCALVRVHLGTGLEDSTSTVGAVAQALATGLGPLALRVVRS